MRKATNLLTKLWLGLVLAWRELTRDLTPEEQKEFEHELKRWPWK